MAVISFANLDQGFNLRDLLTTFTGNTFYQHISTEFAWVTPAPVSGVGFLGTGFSYNGSFVPTSGTVTDFLLDLDSDNVTTAELGISGLSFNLTQLAPLVNGGLTNEQQNDLLWRTVLAGDDTINLGNAGGTQSIDFAGDGRNIGAGIFLRAGNDTITGATGGAADFFGRAVSLTGDVFQIAAGGVVLGGDDTMTITLSARYATGDGGDVSGFLRGGNDTIVATTTANAVVYGDAYNVRASGVVYGGNDTITVVGDGNARGDVYTVNAGGVLIGGNDTIYGSDEGEELYGDASRVDGSAQGGNDTIYGNGGSDTITGDFLDISGNAAGGNDFLYGGAGDDTIYGDAATVTGTLVGGNDLLRGDAGDDTLDGGGGFDTASYQYGRGANINVATGTALDGEGGTDTFTNIEQFIGSAYYRDVFTAADGVQYFLGMGGNDYVVDNGTGGGDVFNGGDGFDTIAFYNRTGATVNLATNSAIVDGVSNMIMGFEEVYGSNTAGDTIVGDANNNTFWGFGGGDVLVGGRGLDTLNGGLGNDTFGFNASDLQAGVWDVISDFHEVANTDFDKLYFNGVAQNQLIFGAANGGVYVSTQALGGNGGVFVAGMTIAGLQDQLLFT